MAKDVCEDCAGDQDASRHLYFESEQDGDANFEIDDESTTSEESQDEDLDEESNDESNEEVWELPSVSEEALPLKKNSPVHRDIDQDQSRDDFRATSSTQSRVRQSQVRGPKDNSRLGETFNARGGSAGDVISTKSVDNPDAVAWPPFGPFENDYPPEERPKLATSQLASRYVKRRKWTRRNAPVEQISGTKRVSLNFNVMSMFAGLTMR